MGAKQRSLTPEHCEIEGCDWAYKIQRHRIHPGRDGGKYKTGNVIALCPNHHFMADNDLIDAQLLHEIVRSRYENGWPPEEMQSMSGDKAVDGVQSSSASKGRPKADVSGVSEPGEA